MKKFVVFLLLISSIANAQPSNNGGAIVITKPASASGSSSIISGTTTITGGAGNQVCFNDTGVISCGDSGFTYDKTNTVISVISAVGGNSAEVALINDASSVLDFTSAGSSSGLTFLGVSSNNLAVIQSSGASSVGLAILTNTLGAMYLGTNNILGLTIGTAQQVLIEKKITRYNTVNTAGWGIPAVYAAARSVAQTAAVASVATYTVGAADGSFLVSANVLVTTSTTHSFSVQVDYTDEGNTARTLTLPVAQLAGTFIAAITNVTGAGPYEGSQLHIRCKALTVITIKTTGTFTTVTYNVDGSIQQIS